MKYSFTIALTTLALMAPVPMLAQERHIVHFQSGGTGASIKGTVPGDGYVDYVLGARRGQTMAVRLSPPNVYFNVLPPGSNGEAIFTGSMSGDSFRGGLPGDGNYIIRVYQMGAAASAGKKTPFEISFHIE